MSRLRHVVLIVLLALGLSAAWSGAATAQDVDGTPPPVTCPVDDGAVAPSAQGGPSATGQCEPSRRFRLIDSAIWVFTLGVLVAVVVALVRSGRAEADR